MKYTAWFEKLLEVQINSIKLLNSLVKVLDINDVMKTGDVTKNVAQHSLVP